MSGEDRGRGWLRAFEGRPKPKYREPKITKTDLANTRKHLKSDLTWGQLYGVDFRALAHPASGGMADVLRTWQRRGGKGGNAR